jgi:two-component sensor histidine kinase
MGMPAATDRRAGGSGMGVAASGGGSERNVDFPVGDYTRKWHAMVFIRHRYLSLIVSIALYAAVILVFGKRLAVSSNYFVLVPVMAASLSFGTIGGFASGALALPANLILFGLLGHPEYSPASKQIAEMSGVAVGLLCGRLSDYFRELEQEIKKRTATEEALRAALAEKQLLLRELHHRVKNNLSVIKSLVQLQRNRSKDPAFLEAADELVGRIFAISLVHDQLDVERSFGMVELPQFIGALVRNLEEGLGLGDSRVELDIDADGSVIQIEAATSLGLIVNEVLTNALKHATRIHGARISGANDEARPETQPSIRLSFKREDFPDGPQYRLVIADDGPGPKPEAELSSGLGMKLVRALARNLGGRAILEAIRESGDEEGDYGAARVAEAAGARFELVFPATFMELI